MVSIRALNYGLLLWGVYVVAEVLVTLLIPRRVLLRRVLVALAALGTMALLFRPVVGDFLEGYAAAATRLAGIESAERPGSPEHAAAASEAVQAGAAAAASDQDVRSQLNLGSALFYSASYWASRGEGNEGYAAAIKSFSGAIQSAPAGSAIQALAYYNRSLAYTEYGDLNRAAADRDIALGLCAAPALSNDGTCAAIIQHVQANRRGS
jgi:hypothetical protein